MYKCAIWAHTAQFGAHIVKKGCCVIVKGVCERARGKRAIKRGNAHKEAQTRKTDVLGVDVF